MSEKPQQETPNVSRETKNKPSSFYVYLIVLFGAAFLMLLLAYFVQRRNSETAYTELQSTMNLSRGELMAQMEALETELAALREERDTLETRLTELQQQKDELAEQSFWRERELQDQLFSWEEVFALEGNFRTEEYDRCVMFFENALTANHYATPPEAADRVEEIYWVLVGKDVLSETDFPLSTILMNH